MHRTWDIARVVLVGVLCVAGVLLCRRPPETDVPEVYDAFCQGVMASDPNQRIHWLGAAARIDPGFAPVYKERAAGYVEKGLYDLAIEDYTRAINLRADYAEAYLSRATAWYRKHSYDRAWSDVAMWRKLGGRKVEPPFIAHLRKASGRTE
ncbi:MAG: tetratricopeptide repeat protein [Phycisphaerae bacterium]|nr:tetratricopeptide repeat protein [Phycisphaerae bacterium]